MLCSTSTLKTILFVINLICALIGVALVWYGIWLLDSLAAQTLDHGEELASVLCILLGLVIVFATIYGIVSIFTESKIMLISYAVLLTVLLITQIILMSFSYAVAKEKLPKGLKLGFEELWDPAHEGNSTLNMYEEWLHCCGRNSAQDYFSFDKKPPDSCCFEQDCANILNIYLEGCELKFREYVSSKTRSFNIISWFLILTEFAASVNACYLVDSIRNHRDRVRFYN